MELFRPVLYRLINRRNGMQFVEVGWGSEGVMASGIALFCGE